MSVEYGIAFRTYPSNCILYQNVSEIVSAKNRSKRGQKRAILGKNDRLGGISFSKRWYLVCEMLYLVPKRWYLVKSGNRCYAYVLAIWVVCVVSPGEDFFFKRRILRFFADTLYHLYQFVSELSVRI